MSLSRLMSVIKKYSLRYPLVPTSCLYFTLYSSGSITKQVIKSEKIHLDSAGRMGFLGGFVLAPVYHSWYKLLDKFFTGNSLKVVLRKLAVDQVVMGTIGLTLFFVGLAVLERKKDIWKDLKEKGPKTYAIGCAYWPIIQGINFKYLPGFLRAPYVAFCAYIWCIFLATVQSQQIVPLKKNGI